MLTLPISRPFNFGWTAGVVWPAAIVSVAGSDARIDFPVSASFGVAATRVSGYDLRELMAHADSALYEAKREGRNRIAIYQLAVTAPMPQAAVAS